MNSHPTNTALPLILFAHIEKTGGTSLNGILRTYHGIHYSHVRALKHAAPPSVRAVHLDDLGYYRRLAPWLRCVSGHAVRPWVLLNEGLDDALFMAVLREPVARYVSYYTYGGGVRREPWPYSFEEYLDKEEFHNYQTKRIAGRADADAAMQIIEQSFLAAATLENMDNLLNRLDSLWPGIEQCASLVGRRNTRKDTQRQTLIERYHETILANNTADMALYEMLKKKYAGLFLRPDFFTESTTPVFPKQQGSRLQEITAALMHRVYLGPLSGLVRLAHGLPYRGTY